MTIDTPRLRLVPFSPGHLLALIDGEERFAKQFGVPAADGLRAFFISDDVSPTWLEALRAAPPEGDVWVHGFAVVHRDEGLAIGSVGFKGRPDGAGAVEIAYGVVPGFQGRGYATEAAAAAVRFATGSGRVRVVRAHTRPTNDASGRVLAKCGFERVGEVVDPEDGLVWRW